MRVCMLAYTFCETDKRVMRYAEALAMAPGAQLIEDLPIPYPEADQVEALRRQLSE